MLDFARDGPRRTRLVLTLFFGALILGCASATKLRPAIEQNDAAQVRRALRSGAAVNGYDENGWTPLLYAARAGHLDIVEILVENGADVQARNREGWSALLLASRYGYPEMVRLLIDWGAYVHSQNHAGYTALTLAAWGGHLEIIQILREAGVRLDVKNDDGKTGLYYAGLNAREDVVRYLLQEGAEVEIFDQDGEDLFATAVTLKVRAALHESGKESRDAEVDYRTAADFFERAEPPLLEKADAYRNRQRAALFLSFLGLVASSVDLKNLQEGNPSFYSELVPQVEGQAMSQFQIMEAYYRGLAKYSLEQQEGCLQRADEIKAPGAMPTAGGGS